MSDFADKPSDDVEDNAPRSRFFGDKSNRKSLNEKDGKDNRESWTAARERRQLGGDDDHKEGRYGRRDRDQDGERRNGHRDREEGGWGRERRQNGEKGGWRDRERDREKKDRDWDRGGAQEKEPEWMDDPTPAAGEDDFLSMGMARNQDEFQKWKAMMSGKKLEDVPQTEASPTKEPAPPKPAASLKLEGIVDKPFGGWGDTQPPRTSETAPTATKTAPGKSKGSRFASMFKDQAKEEPPQPETAPPPPKPEAAAEDEAGFKRILQMLGGTGISQPPAQEGPSSPPPRTTTNGTTKQKSRFTGFFDQTPKSPERVHSPREAPDTDPFQSTRGVSDEPSPMFGGRLAENQQNGQMRQGQPRNAPISPEPMFPQNGNREHQPSRSQHMNDLFLEQPPSRGTATPDNNIQNLLASQRSQRPQGQDKNFLLDLLQTKRPASQQARQDNNFPLWLDQPPSMPETHAPQPRGPPPPGLLEDQLLRNAPQELPRQEQQHMPERRTSQRAPPGAPPGFYDEQTMFLQQQQQTQQAAQRRNFTEPPQQQQHAGPGRRMSGHPNLPQMQIPQHHQQFPGPPPEFLQSPGGHQQAPPGFNPHMPRHPPGFHSVNIFQPPQGGPQGPQQGPGPQQQGREPPGFPQGMPQSAGGMQSPPNAPPGFFGAPQGLPPGFMQTRSPMEGISAGAGPMRGGGRGYDAGYEQMGGPRR